MGDYPNIDCLFDQSRIETRLQELAATIDDYLATLPQEESAEPSVVAICILKGAVYFFTDLTRLIRTPIMLDFMSVHSYGNGTTSSGSITVAQPPRVSLKRKHVIIIEDIVDSGHTLSFLIKYLKKKGAKTVKTCALLNKTCRREANVDVDFIGFEIGDEFIVGYGLDYAQRYRNVPFIGALDPKAYLP